MRKNILTLLLTLMAIVAQAQEGSWKGELNVQGIKLPLVFHFTANGCTIDSPSQGVTGLKAEKSVQYGKVTVKISAIGATFEGVTLGKSISGTLTLPREYTKATPVVVMVTGSGQQNRNEELFGHKPFAVIADALARRGIASLRYDDRGYGDKTVTFTNFTTDDFKHDAEAAISTLRSRFSRVGILGHSEGGTIALMLAAEKKADFIVSLAGMAVSGKETLLWQNRIALSSTGLPTEAIDSYCALLGKVFTATAEGKSLSQIDFGDIPATLQPMIEKVKEQLSVPYIQHFLKIDVREKLPLIKCPVLALNGKKDTQVNCNSNIKALEEGLTNCSHSIKAIDDLNHLFQHCNTGNLVEYQQIEETISPEVLDTIATWISTKN